MIFFANALGTITKIITEPVYQGSVNTGRVVLIAPFPSSVQVTVAFTLPNGMNTQINLTKPNMANVDLGGRVLSPEGKTYNAWTYILNEVITAYAGEATVQFFVYDASGTVVTTYASTFDISPGVPPQLPITPTATIYANILEALAALNSRIDNITGEESGTSATFVNIVNELPDIPINKDGIYIVKNGDSIPQLYVYNKEVGVWIRLDEAVINVDAVEDATDTTKLYNVNNVGLHAFINDKWTLLATAETVGVVNQTAQNALTAANQAQEVANAAMEKVNRLKGGIIFKGNVSNIADLDAPSAETLGYLYNVSTPFETTENFVEGAGKKYPANENVAIVELEPGVYKYDVFSGLVDLSGITGIKLLEITPNADGVSGTLTQETYNEIVNGFANTIITINGYPNNLFKPLFKDENERYIYVLEQNLTVNNETRSLLMYIGVSSNLTWSVIGEEEFRSVYARNNNDGTISLNIGNEQFNLINSLKTVNNQSLIGSGNISIPKGETGAQGPIGPQGVGITNITTGTVSQANGYTLTQVIFEKDNNLSNSINVQAKNGENGLPGADGTIVEANPTEEATANLDKIKIANVVYKIPSDGELAKLNKYNEFEGFNKFIQGIEVNWVDSQSELGRLICTGDSAELTMGDQAAGIIVDFDGSEYNTNIYGDNVNFYGNVDFSNANVTGLPSGGTGGATKTKITLAELQSMITNYSSNVGKLIQVAPKASASYIAMFTQCFVYAGGICQILKTNFIRKVNAVTEINQSEIMCATYELYISATNAYFQWYNASYTYGGTEGSSGSPNTYYLTDANADFYIIGE